jgi:hypothetical protein
LSFDAMHGLTSGPARTHGFGRSAITLIASFFVAALLLMPAALRQTGSAGPAGLALAAGICLLSGVMAEALTSLIAQSSPLGATLIGMMIRMCIPLGVCVVILATGRTGRDYLVFVGYLLAFYMLMLAVETWLAVRRAAANSSLAKQSQR